jgi:hypothetical protein
LNKLARVDVDLNHSERRFTPTSDLHRTSDPTDGSFLRQSSWRSEALVISVGPLSPILNPKELGLTETEIHARAGHSVVEVTMALASYVRTIRSATRNSLAFSLVMRPRAASSRNRD